MTTTLEQQQQAERIKNQIVNLILESPLNVDFIPDDIEREIYLAIFNELEPILKSRRFWTKIKDFFFYLFTCQCCKSPKDQ